jgi:hypothetical protein
MVMAFKLTRSLMRLTAPETGIVIESTGYVVNPSALPAGEMSAVDEVVHSDMPYVPVNIGKDVRLVDPRTIDAMMEFTSNATQRTELGHDCGAFALACQTVKDFSNVDLRPESGNTIAIEQGATLPATPESFDRILPGRAARMHDGSFDSVVHFIVRATSDQDDRGPTLFANKPGTVFLPAIQPLDEITKFYPLPYVTIIENMDLYADPRDHA